MSGLRSVRATRLLCSLLVVALVLASSPALAISPPQGSGGGTVNSAALDAVFGSTQGTVPERGASVWGAVGPGTSGQVLTSNGPAANPSFQASSGAAGSLAATLLVGNTMGPTDLVEDGDGAITSTGQPLTLRSASTFDIRLSPAANVVVSSGHQITGSAGGVGLELTGNNGSGATLNLQHGDNTYLFPESGARLVLGGNGSTQPLYIDGAKIVVGSSSKITVPDSAEQLLLDTTNTASGSILIKAQENFQIQFNGDGASTGFGVYDITAGKNRLEVNAAGSVILNASGALLAQNFTDGATYIPRCATGAPSGTPTASTGGAAIVIGGDHHLYCELTTGSWSQVDGGGGSTPGLASVLGVTGATGGHDITFTMNDAILGSGTGGSSGITAFGMTCRIDGTPFVVDGIGTQLGIVDTTAWAQGVGGGIGFYGLHGPSSPADYGIYGSITGVKSSAVSGEQGGQVSLSTVNNTSVVMLETLRATNDQRTWCCPTASDLGGRLQVDGKVVTSTDFSANILSIDTVGSGTTSGVGGGIGFGFKYDGSNYTFSAGVSGVKENASSGDYSTSLKFITRSLTLNSSNFTEQGRFTSAGSLNLGGITTVGARGDIRTISQFQVYDNVATAGTGVEVIYGAQNVTGQSGATTICTYTPAADGTFEVSAQLNVTAATALTTTIAVTYHDVANNARTLVLPVQLTGGTAGTYLSTGTITASGAADFSTATATIRVKAGTSITTATTSGTFTGVTYSASGSIRQSLQ